LGIRSYRWTLSLFILTKEYILILINVFIDLINRINADKDEPDKEIIYLKKANLKLNIGDDKLPKIKI
jgi:hypothetical protein